MRGRRGSLVLIELMISAAAFIVCFAVCLSIFVSAKKISEQGERLNTAALLAQSAAEQFKGADGDPQELSYALGCDPSCLELYYTRDIQRTDSAGAYYAVTIQIDGYRLRTALITVSCEGETVFKLSAASFSEVVR